MGQEHLKYRDNHERLGRFERLSRSTERLVGSPLSFAAAAALIVIWAATGWFVQWSDTWQLVINSLSSIVTFLMVFLIQATQTRDTRALQLKLDELIRANSDARNALIKAENKPVEEISQLERAVPEDPHPN